MSSENVSVSPVANFEKCSVVLLDVQGTTTSFNFFKETFFPYIIKNAEVFLKTNWEEEDVKAAVKDLSEKELDLEAATKSVVELTESSSDNKGLKILQGLITRKGYADKELKAHVFDDVQEALESWAKSRKVAIYSTGDVNCQKQFFANTVKGDLSAHISNNFDQVVGVKTEADSYKKISEELAVKPEEVVFVTDREDEGKAAKTAGLSVVLVTREGNEELSEEVKKNYPVVSSFSEINFEEKACKRKNTEEAEEPPTKVAKVDKKEKVESEKAEADQAKGEEKIEAEEPMEVDSSANKTEESKSEEKVSESKQKTEEKKPSEADPKTEVKKPSDAEKITEVKEPSEAKKPEEKKTSEAEQKTEDKKPKAEQKTEEKMDAVDSTDKAEDQKAETTVKPAAEITKSEEKPADNEVDSTSKPTENGTVEKKEETKVETKETKPEDKEAKADTKEAKAESKEAKTESKEAKKETVSKAEEKASSTTEENGEKATEQKKAGDKVENGLENGDKKEETVAKTNGDAAVSSNGQAEKNGDSEKPSETNGEANSKADIDSEKEADTEKVEIKVKKVPEAESSTKTSVEV